MERVYMEIKLMVYLMQLGITPNLKGYKYYKEAVIRICENDKPTFCSNQLLKELSLLYNEKVSLLDRALRHAIEVSCKRNGLNNFKTTRNMHFASGKPSPKELMCILAEKVKIDVWQKFYA